MNVFYESEYRCKGKDALYNKAHSHDNCFEIMQIWNNDGNVLIKNRMFPFKAGGIYFINSIDMHCTSPKYPESYERSKISVSKEYVTGILKAAGSEDITSKLFIKNGGSFFIPDEYLAHTLDEEFKKAADKFSSDFAKTVCLLNIFSAASEEQGNGKAPASEKLGAVISYIDKNISEKLSLDMLSRKLSFSKYYLCHMFKAETGLSVMEYITLRRIVAAKKKLLYSDMSVSQISGLCGFSSFSYFTQTFKRIEGISPLNYRKSNKQTKL